MHANPSIFKISGCLFATNRVKQVSQIDVILNTLSVVSRTKADTIKCCKETKITPQPNECHTINFRKTAICSWFRMFEIRL